MISHTVSSVKELFSKFGSDFFDAVEHPYQLRWIDVEGYNGGVVQFMLEKLGCDRQFAFNSIVSGKSRAHGMLIDSEFSMGDDEASTKFLLVSKVPSLTPIANALLSRDSQELYKLNAGNKAPGPAEPSGKGSNGSFATRSTSRILASCSADRAIDYEQISYLMQIRDGAEQLVSFQEGKEGDVFGDVRAFLADPRTIHRERFAPYLLLRLIRAGTESVARISDYMDLALEQLENDSEAISGGESSPGLVTYAYLLEAECELLHRTMNPFESAIGEIATRGAFPEQLMGSSQSGWKSVHVQLKQLSETIQGSKDRAYSLIRKDDSLKMQRQAELQERMETSNRIMGLVLALFSPLSFVTGLYGMNFTKPDGSPGMPELTWGYEYVDPNASTTPAVQRSGTLVTGYGFFWLVVMSLIIGTLLGYLYLGLISVPTGLWKPCTSFFTRLRRKRRRAVADKSFAGRLSAHQATSREPRGVAGPAQAAYSATAVKDSACGGAEA